MRISKTKIVQFIDSDPPQLVLIDESNGTEISLTPADVDILRDSVLPYYHPHMHKMFSLPQSARIQEEK